MENLKVISKEDIISEGKKILDSGGLFVTAVCNDVDSGLEVSYFFSTNNGSQLTCLRYTAAKDEEVPGLSKTTLATVLIENEMRELFGLKIKDLAIDFGGHMLLGPESLKTPLLKTKKAEAKGVS